MVGTESVWRVFGAEGAAKQRAQHVADITYIQVLIPTAWQELEQTVAYWLADITYRISNSWDFALVAGCDGGLRVCALFPPRFIRRYPCERVLVALTVVHFLYPGVRLSMPSGPVSTTARLLSNLPLAHFSHVPPPRLSLSARFFCFTQ